MSEKTSAEITLTEKSGGDRYESMFLGITNPEIRTIHVSEFVCAIYFADGSQVFVTPDIGTNKLKYKTEPLGDNYYNVQMKR